MKQKQSRAKKETDLHCRMTPYYKNRIKGLAGLYAGGNVSLFVTWASLNAPRRVITKDDLEPKARKKR